MVIIVAKGQGMAKWIRQVSKKRPANPDMKSSETDVNEPLKHDCACSDWGNCTWRSIHYSLAHLPEHMTKQVKAQTWAFLHAFGIIAPCHRCRRNWRIIMDRLGNHRTVIMQSAQSVSCMFFDLHNVWNAQLGKGIMSFETFKKTYNCPFNQINMYDQVTKTHINIEDMVAGAESAARGQYGDQSDDSREVQPISTDSSPDRETWDV